MDPRDAMPADQLDALGRAFSDQLLACLDECARGRLSRGKVAELLGLSFRETEELFRAHRVPYPIKTSADDAFDIATLPGRR